MSIIVLTVTRDNYQHFKTLKNAHMIKIITYNT